MVFWITLWFFRLIAWIYFRGRAFGRENLPKAGSYIGVINHESNLDVLAMSMVVNRPVHTMAKESLFRVPILKWWLKALHMFPIRRGTFDRRAFSHSLRLLQRGRIIFMAPEGTRKRQAGKVRLPARTGFVRLAHLVGCPVVPIAVTGTGQALPPHAWFPRPVRIQARVGEPIVLPKVGPSRDRKQQLQSQAETVMDRVYEMLDELTTRGGRKKTRSRSTA